MSFCRCALSLIHPRSVISNDVFRFSFITYIVCRKGRHDSDLVSVYRCQTVRKKTLVIWICNKTVCNFVRNTNDATRACDCIKSVLINMNVFSEQYIFRLLSIRGRYPLSLNCHLLQSYILDDS